MSPIAAHHAALLPSSVGAYTWDTASNLVTWTEALRGILGLPAGEVSGPLEDFLAHVHPDDVDGIRAALFDALRARGTFSHEHRVVRPDGSERFLSVRGEVVVDPGGQPPRVTATAWDVTELSLAIQTSERAASLLQATVDATADGIVVIGRDGHVSLMNEGFRSMWGLSSTLAEADEEALLRMMLSKVEDPDGLRLALLEQQERPERDSDDLVRLRDGRVIEQHARPQRVRDKIVGRVVTYRDVTERERMLQYALFLSDATRLLASLDVEGALGGVARLALQSFADACAVDLFTDGEPQRLIATARDPHRPAPAALHPDVLSERSVIYRHEGGSCLGVPFVSGGGLVGAMTLVAPRGRTFRGEERSVAEALGRRAALAIENSRLYRHAQQAVAVRDEFLSIASHEIRGPITAMHLAVQMLRRDQVAGDALDKACEIIEREDRRLSRFVDELLDVSRIRSGTLRFSFENVDLGEVVRAVVNRLGSEAARVHSTMVLTIDTPVHGEWDPFRLDQIVTNLLANAIKFGLGRPIDVSVTTGNGRAVLSVRDRGIGVTPEVRERLFTPFSRGVSARNYGGLGLGLYIVKTIVDGLGGEVRVESENGAGATFIVELPLWRPR